MTTEKEMLKKLVSSSIIVQKAQDLNEEETEHVLESIIDLYLHRYEFKPNCSKIDPQVL